MCMNAADELIEKQKKDIGSLNSEYDAVVKSKEDIESDIKKLSNQGKVISEESK